jgi:hypothetical protein
MEMNNSSFDSSMQTSKKPYEKPSFRFEEVFVTTALSCGKTVSGGPGGGSCQGNTSAS